MCHRMPRRAVCRWLGEFRLHCPRPWGACWAFVRLWRQHKLDEFWQPRLGESREGTDWHQVLMVLVAYRLIDPGSEWRLHREWFERSAMGDLPGGDASLAAKDTLYRCLDKVLAQGGAADVFKAALAGFVRRFIRCAAL